VQLFFDKGADDLNHALICAIYGGHLHVVQFFVDKEANDLNYALAHAAEDGHMHIVQCLIECGATQWPRKLLEQHPDAIVTLFQRGKVPRQKFAQHNVFEQQIVAFLDWQQQASLQLYDICLLPHELCALVVAY
jgi:hypothetical protein